MPHLFGALPSLCFVSSPISFGLSNLLGVVLLFSNCIQHAVVVSLPSYHVIQQLPMFGSRMHPGSFMMLSMVEDDICDHQVVLRADS